MTLDARTVAEKAIGLFVEELERRGWQVVEPPYAVLREGQLPGGVVGEAQAAAVLEVVEGVEADVEPERQKIGSVTRGSSPRAKGKTGPDSRMFYPPVEATIEQFAAGDGTGCTDCVVLSVPDRVQVRMWPDEAEEVGVLLIRAAHEARSR